MSDSLNFELENDDDFLILEADGDVWTEQTDYGLNDYMDANKLVDAYWKAAKTNQWKHMTQKFYINLMKNVFSIQYSLMSGTYEQEPFYEFQISERGKVRDIRANVTRDRVVQRDISDNILVHKVMKFLIYDNGASVKKKGISFSRNRVHNHLLDYISKHGPNGWVLQIDFKKFFDSIPHKEMIELFRRAIQDDQVMDILKELIHSFSRDGEDKSLGIGSQISQIGGIYYPTRLDNYFKIVRGIKYYSRYMDDVLIIHEDKEVLEDLYLNFKRIAEEMKLTINEKKSHITPLRDGFIHLKLQYIILDSGAVVTVPCKDTFIRERRKLRKWRQKLDSGKMPYYDIENSFKSWYYSYDQYACRKSLHNTLRLYAKLYRTEVIVYSRDTKFKRLVMNTQPYKSRK